MNWLDIYIDDRIPTSHHPSSTYRTGIWALFVFAAWNTAKDFITPSAAINTGLEEVSGKSAYLV